MHHSPIRFLTSVLAVLLVLSASVVVSTPEVRAGTTITVTQMTDELNEASNNVGDCSLREAVVAANEDRAVGGCPAGNGADTIIVPARTYTFMLPDGSDPGGYNGDLDLTDSVTIRGAGTGKTIIDGNQLDRVSHVYRFRNRSQGRHAAVRRVGAIAAVPTSTAVATVVHRFTQIQSV